MEEEKKGKKFSSRNDKFVLEKKISKGKNSKKDIKEEEEEVRDQ